MNVSDYLNDHEEVHHFLTFVGAKQDANRRIVALVQSAQLLDRSSALDALSFVEETGKRVVLDYNLMDV